jgi:sodium/potassium-transporting ATPase subunit alpha
MVSELKKVQAGGAKKDNKGKDAMAAAVSGTEAIRTWDDHLIGIPALAAKFGTDAVKGLTDDQAKAKLAEHGENALSKKEAVPWYCHFLEEMTGFFSLLLWFGSALCFIGYILDSSDKANLYLGITLAVVVFLTGCFSYAQSSKSAEMMAQFENFIPPIAYVVRNGQEVKIDAKKIVPGDIVMVKGGENIPCDVCIIRSNEMKVSNASLTGESEDIQIDPDLEPVQNIFETKNVGFFGTQCTAGDGIGICFRTGDATVIGQIANLASSAEAVPTPLSIEIERFIKIISSVAIFLGVLFFIMGVIYDYPIITNIVFAIGIIVANVPEGLLATVTVSLALTAQRMAMKMVLVKNLESVETLGSTSCICSDKTGTLTQNKMTVSHVFFNRTTKDCSVNWQAHQRNALLAKPDEKMIADYDITDNNFLSLITAVVCGTYTIFNYDPTDDECKMLYARIKKVAVASLEDKTLPAADMKEMAARLKVAEQKMLYTARHCKGDASETGLVQFAQGVMDLDETRGATPVHVYKNSAGKETLCQIPFSSDIKFNAFIRDLNPKERNPTNADDNLCIYLKGAPERVLKRCSKILLNGEEVPMTADLMEEINKANSDFGRLGERVLAFARCKLDPAKYNKETYQFDLKTWKNWGLDPNLH